MKFFRLAYAVFVLPALLLSLAPGCMPYVLPKTCYFPEIDLRPNNDTVHVFQVDTTDDRADGCLYFEPPTERIRLISYPKDGVLGAQTNILFDQGFLFGSFGFHETQNRALRLYRRGYETVELKCGEGEVHWTPVAEVTAMERALDKIWSCDEDDWEQFLQEVYGNWCHVTEPARKVLASEYESLANSLESANEHPTAEQQNQIQRLRQKAKRLRQSKSI